VEGEDREDSSNIKVDETTKDSSCESRVMK
jgi:hypothetical protein